MADARASRGGLAAITRIDGEIGRVLFYNPDNGHTVAQVRVADAPAPVTLVGKLPNVQPGERIAASGRWTAHPQYGRQFLVHAATTRPPDSLDGLRAFLGGGLVPGLGPVLADRLVTHFGTGVLDILDHAPQRLREVAGLGEKRQAWLRDAWRDQRAVRAIAAFLFDHGLSTLYTRRILQVFGPDAPQILVANPYRLAQEIPELGFAASDAIGQRGGTPSGAPARLQAGVEATLHEAAGDGHTFLPVALLQGRAAALLGVDDPAVIAGTVRQLVLAGRLAYGPSPDGSPPPDADTPPRQDTLLVGRGGRTVRLVGATQPTIPPATAIYRADMLSAERTLAQLVSDRARPLGDVDAGRLADWLDRWCASRRVALAPEQRAAIAGATNTGLHVITGGPGTGKSTTVRALAELWRSLGRNVALAAPTGKATKRLSEATGAPAQTLHRLLGARGDAYFAHDARDPLPADVLIVDEASMLDLDLAGATLRALRPDARLVLVGDVDQLPSVGPGRVLGDLLDSGLVTATRLTRVFRQGEGSAIIRDALRVRAGDVPLAEPAPRTGPLPSDCLFVEARRAEVARVVADWAVREVPGRLGLDARQDVQVLAALNRTVGRLNAELQERLNPARLDRPERPRGAMPLRLGDRVIQTANDYDRGVFNGETGHLVEIDERGGACAVDFGDRRVEYPAGALYHLDHAYALTVHRAQGSEWPVVVVALTEDDAPLLQRALLYTALTRARRCCVLIGERSAFARAVASDEGTRRYTGLTTFLRGASDSAEA